MWRFPAPASPVVVSSSPIPADSLIKSSVDSFLKDGRKICVGDCALFQAGNAPPFIGIIRWFTTDKEDCFKLCVNWLYRPADIKLVKGILLEAAPNEVFYSFHKDVISAASLLHPCKVSFLQKGVELPPGLSSFVCRRVYDIANKCLWWLTDHDYINERQEEVDQLLGKTRLEMHAAVQSGDCSPKPSNGATSTQLKSDSESVHNSSTTFPSQVKGKKRERGGDQGTEPIKRERPAKLEDGESASSRLDNMAKVEIAKITEKGSLISTEGVEKLVHLMQLDRNEREIDLSGRILFADVIASTDRIECLGRFVQLRGVPVLDDWLQEAHKGKTGDGSSPKESDKGTEELLLALLRALDKLPVNLNALQTCNIGKSVNHLRTHKNLEIQKKARCLVDTWKKRVDAEMTKINDAKSGGSNQAVTWPGKMGFSEVSHGGGRRPVSTETTTKTPGIQTSTCRTVVGKPDHVDAIVKSTLVAQGSLKLSSSSSLPASVSISLKDSPGKGAGGSGNSDLPLATVKEEKSSSSSHSQNNSQPYTSDHAKRMSSSWKEDARSSTAGSMSANKNSGSSSRRRKLSNGLLGSGVSGVQKETNLVKAGSVNRSAPMDKASSQSGLSSERALGVASADHGNSHRLIVRLPNTGRSPARGSNGASLEDPSISRTSSPSAPDKNDQTDQKAKQKGDAYRSHLSADMNAESWQSNDVKDEGDRSPATVLDDEQRNADEIGKGQDAPRPACSSSGNGKIVFLTKLKSRDSFSSMNALIESCAKYSEPSALSAGDDIGINLLANVAAGEISKSDFVSPSASPGRSPKEEPCAANKEAKSKFSCEDSGAQNHGHSDENTDFDSTKQGKGPASQLSIEKLQETTLRPSGIRGGVESNGANQSAVDDNKRVNCTRENIAESTTKHSNLAGNSLGDNPMIGEKPDKLLAEESATGTPLVNEVSSCATMADQLQLPVTENHSQASDRNGNDAKPSSIADKFPGSESADVCTLRKSDGFKDDILSPADSARKEQSALAPRSTEQARSAAVSPDTCTWVDEILERKEVPTEESGKCAKPVYSKLSEADQDKKEKITSAEASSVLVTSVDDTVAKLDFDLNEGFSGDDGNHSEYVISSARISPANHLPAISPFAPAPITVAAPAKGPFVPPENLLKSKGEPGWKGSAATSAFRPAEPRKVLEMPLNTCDMQSSDTASKQSRPAFEIDLNVADERVLEDLTSQSSPQTTGSESGTISNRDALTRSAGGLDLDLNKVDEGTDNGQFAASISSRLEAQIMSMKPVSRGFPNGEANMLRDFDLNGPGLDEMGPDTLPKNRHARINSNNMPFLPQLSGLRMGNTEIRNVSSWFPPGNSYPAVAVSSFLPDRGEQTYPIVTAPGSQRNLVSVTGGGNFNGDVYRGPVLSSSPAMTFSHATIFPYPAGFPFGSSFPLTSTSFDSPGAASCYSSIPSQFVDQAAAVSSHYARPYMINLPVGSASTGSQSIRKWSRQDLDLNAGPGGGADVDAKDERLSSSRQLPIFSSPAFVEEQARMYQVSGGGMKRKDRDGGSWDERLFKQPSWQ